MKLLVLAMCVALSLGATSFIFGSNADDDTKCYFYAKVADSANAAAEEQSVFIVASATTGDITDGDAGAAVQSTGNDGTQVCSFVTTTGAVASSDLTPAAGTTVTGATTSKNSFTEDDFWLCIFSFTKTAADSAPLSDIISTGAAYIVGTDKALGEAYGSIATTAVVATAALGDCATASTTINDAISSTAGYISVGAVITAASMNFF